MAESEFTKTADFDFPTSPPMNFHELTSSQNPSWESLSHGVSGYNQSSSGSQTNVQRSHNPSRAGEMVAVKTQTGPEVPIKRMSADKSVSVEAAERDWEEKRAALTQYSAKDINRLLEETQAELMKAIPDLEFAAKHKQSGSTTSTPEHKPTKPQHTSKGTTKIDPNGRRGSEELTVPRYRTEKPSKSPPPPPPRRSFPSSHGITTARTGEVIVTSKKETTYIKKADSEELESQKPQVKLRRTVSEVARPASTPPIIASGIKDDDDEDRIIAELEVFQRSLGSPIIPQFHCDQVTAAVSSPRVDLWPHEAIITTDGWKDLESSQSPSGTFFCLPQIILSECVPNKLSSADKGIELFKGISSAELGKLSLEMTDNKESPGECSVWELKGNTLEEKKNCVQLEQGLKKTGWSEGITSLQDDLYGSFLPCSTTKAPTEAKLHPVVQYMEGSELHIEYMPIPNRDEKPLKDILAFFLTMSMIHALSREEVHELLKLKQLDFYALNVDIVQGQNRAEIRSNEPFIRLDRKPLLVIFEEPLELTLAYVILLSVLEEDQECKASVGFQRDVICPIPENELTTKKCSPCSDADGGYLKPTGVEHPQDSTGLSSQKQPVPKPRTFPGKDMKHHLSKPCRVHVSKLLHNSLSQFIQSGETSSKKMLKVLTEQEDIDLHKSENEQNLPRQSKVSLSEHQYTSLDISDRAKETFSEPKETPILGTSAKNIGEIGNTYQKLDSLEDTIRALELAFSEISQYQSSDIVFSRNQDTHQLDMLTAGSVCSRVLRKCNVSDDEQAPQMDPQNGKQNNPKMFPPLKAKPPLLPKPQIAVSQSGGVSIPAMKMVNPAASRLKVTQQQGSPDKSKHIKQRMEYMRIQGQQQAAKPSKEASGVNDTSNPGSEKSSPARTSIPVLTSFGTRNSSISF